MLIYEYFKKDRKEDRGVKQETAFEPFAEFFRDEAAGGIILLLSAIVAIVLANSGFSHSYHQIWERTLSITSGDFILNKNLHHWINDGLMAIFFFLVGLEIKREIMVGELNTLRLASFPVSAAIGGMIIPALIYVAFNHGTPGANGWGIPMATDIAFALGILSLQGSKASLPLRVFLTALAIVDDLGAVVVIAAFYTAEIAGSYLIAAGIIFALLLLARAWRIRSPLIYVVLGIFLWFAILQSGIHATVAGVLLAMTIPSRRKINTAQFITRTQLNLQAFARACGPDAGMMANKEQLEALQSIEIACHQAEAPMQRMEHAILPYVTFFIIPLFAFANAGVTLQEGLASVLSGNISLGIMLGLVVGKPLGILSFAWLAVKLGLADLPEGIQWKEILGVGFLAGIGFTMSLFITDLAFPGDEGLIYEAKVGILLASLIAAICGYVVLLLAQKRKLEKEESESDVR